MTSLRALFLALSRMPPALMLVLIIGLAVLITTMVTSQEQTNEAKKITASASLASAEGSFSNSNLSSANHKSAVYSRTYIPSGTTIEAKQIELKSTNDLELWDDASQDQNMIVGAKTRRAIPANSQIRKIDLNDGSTQY